MTVEMSRAVADDGTVTTDTVHWGLGRQEDDGTWRWITSLNCENHDRARATLERMHREYPDIYQGCVVIRMERTVIETPWEAR